MAFLREFNFEMKHLNGKENRVADALSMKLHSIYEIRMSPITSNILEIIKEGTNNDLKYTFLWKQTKESLRKEEKSEFGINYDNLLTFRNIIYIPNQTSITLLILDEFHKKPYVGHPGY